MTASNSDESDSYLPSLLDEEESTNPAEEEEEEEIANEKGGSSWTEAFAWSQDTKNVFIWMLVVLAMIGITSAIVLSLSITFLENERKTLFQNGFQQQANIIAESTRFHAKTVVGSLESMSDTITSYAGATNVSWPFVEVPDFDRRGQRARGEASLETIAFSPVVTYEDRIRWSNFTAYNSDWLRQNTTVPSDIYRVTDNSSIITDDSILMIPVWMTSPAPHDTSLINFNVISDETYSYLFNAMTESKHSVLSGVYQNMEIYTKVFQLDDQHMLSDSPHSILMAPVYDSFNTSTRSLAGIIHGTLAWDNYLMDILPPGVNGITAVLKNSCGQIFTFQIDGPKARFLGVGDLHEKDHRFEKMAIELGFGSNFMLGERTRTYRQCFYSLVIFPAEEFEENYHSSNTAKFTAFLAVVFACLALFFFIFVWFVQRRQQRVVGIATRTTTIISNLFPDNVRERIMKQAEEQANREADGNSGADASTNFKGIMQDKFNNFGSDALASQPCKSHTHNGVKVLEDAPIADLYPNCTVFFCDLVGFTSWSSSREPAQVFVLLETLYGAFDAIANKRRIFKVETIGDCYVAVTGLPQPRRDHALGMARFASDCLSKSSEVFHCLEDTLGPGTNLLNLRIGLHSGPVTAGVLRGIKGRFQLFGDTVNTAARMESNSLSGMIHCSKDTADLIKAGGKPHWVSERPDKIIAKGKGEMTTYWISVRSSVNDGTTDSMVTIPNGEAFWRTAQESNADSLTDLAEFDMLVEC